MTLSLEEAQKWLTGTPVVLEPGPTLENGATHIFKASLRHGPFGAPSGTAGTPVAALVDLKQQLIDAISAINSAEKAERDEYINKLRDEIKTLLADGKPVPSQLVRIARGQMDLREVLPRYMVLVGQNYLAIPEGASIAFREGEVLEDMWSDRAGYVETLSTDYDGTCFRPGFESAKLGDGPASQEVRRRDNAAMFAPWPGAHCAEAS